MASFFHFWLRDLRLLHRRPKPSRNNDASKEERKKIHSALHVKVAEKDKNMVETKVGSLVSFFCIGDKWKQNCWWRWDKSWEIFLPRFWTLPILIRMLPDQWKRPKNIKRHLWRVRKILWMICTNGSAYWDMPRNFFWWLPIHIPNGSLHKWHCDSMFPKGKCQKSIPKRRWKTESKQYFLDTKIDIRNSDLLFAFLVENENSSRFFGSYCTRTMREMA